MTILRVTLKPELGNNQKMADLLTDWANWRGGEGDSVAVSRSVWGANGQLFHAVSSHGSIGEADETRRKMLVDDRYQNLVRELSGLLAAPPSWELMDVIVPANRQGAPKSYSIRASILPKIGQIQEAKGVLEDFVKDAQANGAQMSLLQQVWGSSGAMFAVRTAYDSLGEADERRKSYAGSADYQEFISKLSPTISAPASWEINESIASVGM